MSKIEPSQRAAIRFLFEKAIEEGDIGRGLAVSTARQIFSGSENYHDLVHLIKSYPSLRDYLQMTVGHSNEPSLVARGDLSTDEILLLDVTLLHARLPISSDSSFPATVGWVCLQCGSVGVHTSDKARDTYVETFDVTCCGKTVWFHSDHRVLVDVSKLILL
jgi:hypothetical protein